MSFPHAGLLYLFIIIESHAGHGEGNCVVLKGGNSGSVAKSGSPWTASDHLLAPCTSSRRQRNCIDDDNKNSKNEKEKKEKYDNNNVQFFCGREIKRE